MTNQAANSQTDQEELVEKAKVALAEQRRAIQRALEALGETNAAIRSLENRRPCRSVNARWA